MAALWKFQLLCIVVGLSSAHSAPAPAAADCSAVVSDMVDCLSFVTAGGTATKPEGTCCSGLKKVVKNNPDCLCQAFRNSAQLGISVNVTKAVTLPAACHVTPPPSLTTCALSAGTGVAPALSPLAVSPSTSVAGAPTTSIGGNEGAPAPSLGSSGSSMLTSSLGLVVLVALILSVLL